MAQTTSLAVTLTATQTGTLDLGTVSDALRKAITKTFAHGTASGQANMIFTDTRSVLTTANDDIDLSGTLVNAIGGTAVFTAIKIIMITAAVGNTGNLLIGGHDSAPFIGPFSAAGTVELKPDGCFLYMAPATGYTVTATTGDLLRVHNSSGATSSYDIVLVGIA